MLFNLFLAASNEETYSTALSSSPKLAWTVASADKVAAKMAQSTIVFLASLRRSEAFVKLQRQGNTKSEENSAKIADFKTCLVVISLLEISTRAKLRVHMVCKIVVVCKIVRAALYEIRRRGRLLLEVFL